MYVRKNAWQTPENKLSYTYNDKKEVSVLSDRRAALDNALRQIEKQFGKGSIMKLGESTHMQVETISADRLHLILLLA